MGIWRWEGSERERLIAWFGFDGADCVSKAPGDPVLTADMDTCSEALAQLDDVIMHTFQQCVYHLTKVKHAAVWATLFNSEKQAIQWTIPGYIP